jgi:hypothetical protein
VKHAAAKAVNARLPAGVGAAPCPRFILAAAKTSAFRRGFVRMKADKAMRRWMASSKVSKPPPQRTLGPTLILIHGAQHRNGSSVRWNEDLELPGFPLCWLSALFLF